MESFLDRSVCFAFELYYKTGWCVDVDRFHLSALYIDSVIHEVGIARRRRVADDGGEGDFGFYGVNAEIRFSFDPRFSTECGNSGVAAEYRIDEIG